MNKKEIIKNIKSINKNYSKKWLKTLGKDILNKLLIDNMIVSLDYCNKFVVYEITLKKEAIDFAMYCKNNDIFIYPSECNRRYNENTYETFKKQVK